MIEYKNNQSNYPFLKGSTKKQPQFFLNRSFNFNEKPILSVVGAREVQPWVLEWMENELKPIVTLNRWTLLSGGARGVDQKAHSLAIRQKQPTLIMLPCDLENIYPKTLLPWKNCESAVFMSPYPKGTEFHRARFYERNELIVRMSRAILVVQAAEKSGSMMTAKAAMDQHIPIATLPASPLDPAFSGNNQLLYEGASMVRDARDLMVFLSFSANCDAVETDPPEVK